MEKKQTTEIDPLPEFAYLVLSGPPGPVSKPSDCPGFGQELPTTWTCPECPISRACYEAYKKGQDQE